MSLRTRACGSADEQPQRALNVPNLPGGVYVRKTSLVHATPDSVSKPSSMIEKFAAVGIKGPPVHRAHECDREGQRVMGRTSELMAPTIIRRLGYEKRSTRPWCDRASRCYLHSVVRCDGCQAGCAARDCRLF